MNIVQAELKLSSELTNAIKIAITNATREAVNDLNKNNNKWPMYMDKGTAAKYLGISYNTLNNWIANGLPYKRIAGSYRFNRNDLDKFMATK